MQTFSYCFKKLKCKLGVVVYNFNPAFRKQISKYTGLCVFGLQREFQDS